MSDDVRDLLRTYAAGTPDLDPRAGLAARLARHGRNRRAAVAAIACFAALVAGTGVAALTADHDTSGLVATDPSPAPSPSTVPEPTSEPTEEPSPTAEPTEEPTSEPTTPAPTSSPPDTRYSGVASGAHGLRLRIALEEADPETATYYTLRVVVSDDDGEAFVAEQPDFGDGGYPHRLLEPDPPDSGPSPAPGAAAAFGPNTPPQPCAPPSPGVAYPSRHELRWRYAWRHDGTYVISVTARSDDGCGGEERPREEATARLRVTVRQGKVLSNGPLAPTGDIQEIFADEEAEPYTVRAHPSIFDYDGFPAYAVIDWGDGSAPVTVRNTVTCADGDGRHWPVFAGFVPRPRHTYADPGEYVVTMTFTSAGCDGRSEQHGTVTNTILLPATDDGPL